MNNGSARGGMSLWGVLLVVLITLKLTGAADISWFWVFCPVWIPIGLMMLIFMVPLIFGAIAALLSKK